MKVSNATTAALLCATLIAAVPALAEDCQQAYTNHAGVAIAGTVMSLDLRAVVISNETEKTELPLAIFPESEKRRMAVDFAKRTGDMSALRVPPEIRQAIEANEKAIRRSANRAAKGLCTEEEAKAFMERSRKAREAFLEQARKDGKLTKEERALLNQKADQANAER